MRYPFIPFIAAAIAFALACSRDGAGDAPSASTSATAPTPASSLPIAAVNDGTDPKSPILSPDDANFTDSRKGLGWGDRCFSEIRAGKFGWARAACDRALALPEVDPKARAALLYNEGLIAKKSGDAAAARNYFTQSLGARSSTDPGRAEVESELASVGGSPIAPAKGATNNVLTCVADTGSNDTIVATIDSANTGSVVIQSASETRRIRTTMTPYAATEILLFNGYDPGDQKPAGEKLAAGSIVARVVAIGEKNRLYFDSGFRPSVQVPPSGFFACK
jgi:hypothetical protein